MRGGNKVLTYLRPWSEIPAVHGKHIDRHTLQIACRHSARSCRAVNRLNRTSVGQNLSLTPVCCFPLILIRDVHTFGWWAFLNN